MPFITQGKINLQYILIVVVLAAIVGGGTLGYYYLWIAGLETRLAEIEIRLPEVKPPAIEVPEEVTLTPIPQTIRYESPEYFYSLAYPSQWTLYEGFPESPGRVITIWAGTFLVYLNVHNLSERETFKYEEIDQEKTSYGAILTRKVQNTTINNIPGQVIFDIEDLKGETSWGETYILYGKKYIYRLWLTGAPKVKDGKYEFREEFETVVNSFKLPE
ncbi:MAG TPA: hypothetical protein ENI19_03645 [Candidatus Nealsonbacteria bacterium]|uniref:Uncharacterized protein n=1 Tax=marine sediment metagenome TaxID=412755 RepID=A0A0F9UZA4_9ZZZZ|nr:hypothetical protein [Candidatus Nealsonbacteria bacterium]HEB46770.1 hypothetical protein [Candidatus Nealsonbacteria bacterium]